ncbi:hypothetical protein LZ32DRAFT_651177 [Colletotrichum eremochloae]|nr:hypothetical protein LZ32DRAFT_651177 [Colletotrichum eremochloae]
MISPSYTPVACQDFERGSDTCDAGHDSSHILEVSERRKSERLKNWILTHSAPWIISFVLVLVVLVQNAPAFSSKGSYETGYLETELHSAFQSIHFRKSEFQQPDDPSIVTLRKSPYIGEPSTELDDTWRTLVSPTFLYLNDDEIGKYAEQTLKTEKGWVTGPSNNSDEMLLKSHTHTCRHFSRVHEWAVERSTYHASTVRQSNDTNWNRTREGTKGSMKANAFSFTI